MTTIAQPAAAPSRPLLTLKRLVFLALGLLTAFTIVEHEVPLLDPANPDRVHIAPFRWWLAPHIAAAAIALVTGPLQFSDTLRSRNPSFHRWLGRTYVLAVLVAAALALYIGVVFEIRENRVLMGTMAGLWLAVTGLAWVAIRNRQINQHKLWISRSYLLTLTFVTTRFIPDIVLPHMGYAGVTALYWVLIVFSLMAPDLLINGRGLLARRGG